MKPAHAWVAVVAVAVVAAACFLVLRLALVGHDATRDHAESTAPLVPVSERHAVRQSEDVEARGADGETLPVEDRTPRVPELVDCALDGTAAIAGRVVDARGWPIRDVEVKIRSTQDRPPQATTDARGRFHIGELKPEPVELGTKHPRYVYAVHGPYEPEADHVLQGVELVLVEGGVVAGTVRTEEGDPVGHAYISFTPVSQATSTDEPKSSGADTDRFGRYVSPALVPGAYLVKARWLDGDQRTVEVGGGETVSGVDLTAPAGGVVRGHVEDYHGHRIAGAYVDLQYRHTPYRPSVAGPDGEFVLPCLDPDMRGHLIVASAPGFYETTVNFHIPAEGLVIKLRPAPVLSGRVVDKTTGAPIEAYRVGICKEFVIDFQDEQHHPDGRFALTITETAGWRFIVLADGYAAWVSDSRTVREGDTLPDVAVELVRGVDVTFRVTTPAEGARTTEESAAGATPAGRAPVAGARIVPSRRADVPAAFSYQVWTPPRTGDDGTCRVERVPPGRYEFEVVHSAFPVVRTAVDVTDEQAAAPGATHTVDVVLTQGGTLLGRVVAKRDGSLIAGAHVRLLDRPVGDHASAEATTDDFGAFVLDGVTPGDYRLQVVHDDYTTYREKLCVTAQRADEILVELARRGSVSGRVTTGAGEPITGAVVRIGNVQQEWTTDENGWFEVPRLDAGEYGVFVANGTSAYRDKATVVEGEDCRIDVVFRGAAICGTVSGPDTPRYGLMLWVEPVATSLGVSPGSCSKAYLRGDLDYRIEDVRPGTYRLYVDDAGVNYLISPVAYTVHVGDTDVQFDIDFTSSTIDGVVHLNTGSPATGAWVTLTPIPDEDRDADPDTHLDAQGVGDLDADRVGDLDAQGAGDLDAEGVGDRVADLLRTNRPYARRFRTDGTGVFTIVGVEPGRYTLSAAKDGFVTQTLAFTKEAGADLSGLKLTLPPGTPFDIDVHTPDGEFPVRLHVDLLDRDGRISSGMPTWRNAQTGRYAVPFAAPGPQTLIAYADGYAPWRGQVTLAAGEQTTAVVELGRGHSLAATVTDASGRPVPAAHLILDPGGPRGPAARFVGQVGHTTADTAGRAALDHLPDAAYTLHVRRPGYEYAAVPVTIAGADQAVSVTLRPSAE